MVFTFAEKMRSRQMRYNLDRSNMPSYFDKILFIRLNEKFWRNRLLNMQSSFGNSRQVGCPISTYGKRDIHRKECFSVMKLQFEGKLYPVPTGYDEVLKNIYGNYMLYPPIENRISNHDVIFVWNEDI